MAGRIGRESRRCCSGRGRLAGQRIAVFIRCVVVCHGWPALRVILHLFVRIVFRIQGVQKVVLNLTQGLKRLTSRRHSLVGTVALEFGYALFQVAKIVNTSLKTHSQQLLILCRQSLLRNKSAMHSGASQTHTDRYMHSNRRFHFPVLILSQSISRTCCLLFKNSSARVGSPR